MFGRKRWKYYGHQTIGAFLRRLFRIKPKFKFSKVHTIDFIKPFPIPKPLSLAEYEAIKKVLDSQPSVDEVLAKGCRKELNDLLPTGNYLRRR